MYLPTQKKIICSEEQMIRESESDGGFNLNRRFAGQGDNISVDLDTVGCQAVYAGAADMDDVFGAPEFSGHGELVPVVGHTGCHL